MAEWPGFRRDGANVWRRLQPDAKVSKRDKEIEQAASLPKSVRGRGKVRSLVARDKIRAIAEQVAETGTLPVPASSRSVGRKTLVNGEHRSRPNHHLLASALRYVPKGREVFVGCILRAARNGDVDATAWMKVFDALLPSEQDRVDFDDVCEGCGVTPDRIMAVVISTMMKMGNDTADFVSAVFHPQIVHQTAKSAMRIGGEFAAIAQRDREMMLQHAKFIAGPKGVSVNVNAQANAAAAAQQQPSVPTFAESVIGAQQAQFGVQRAIAATPIVEEPS